MATTNQDPFSGQYAHRVHGMKASEIRALFEVANRPEIVSLAGGMPCVSALPLEEISELVAQLLRDRGATALQYASGQGDIKLREVICDVMASEDVRASASDVVVTVGSQHALTILATTFLDPGDIVLAEGPSYVGALGAFSAAEAKVIHIPMDDHGLCPDALEETLSRLASTGIRPKFLYTVPNFHNPAGVTLSYDRRIKILELAEKYDLLVIEDNPYGLLSFGDPPGPSLRSLNSERVIYLGSFSKTFASGMRTGWILAPGAIRQKLVLINEAQILCPSMLTQMVITEYFTHHPWREQLKRFQRLYEERCLAMCDSLAHAMPHDVTWTVPRGGFYIWLTLPNAMNSKTLLPRALAQGVAYVPGIGFFSDGQGRRQLRLSYCFPEPSVIREGVRRLASALTEEIQLRELFDRTEWIP